MMVSIFLPMYNEEDVLERSVLRVYGAAKNLGDDFEIVIVDDSSKDGSMKIGKKLEKSHKNIKYLRYDNGPSRRENLAVSFRHARGEVIIFSDTDLAADISALRDLVNAVKQNYDIAVGSRYLKGSKVKRGITRRTISFFYNFIIRVYLNSKIKDHNCGFKAFKKDVILDLVKDAGYDKKLVRGWFWDAEVLIRAQRKKYRIIEIPVKWVEPKKSTCSFKREIRMIPYIFKLKNRLR